MASLRGRERTKAHLRQLPDQIERNLIRGAARAAIGVIAKEASDRVTSDEVRENLTTSVRKRDDSIVATLSVKLGWARAVANWLEYGTSGHFISVDPVQSGGRSVRRVNDLARKGSLVIAGKPVGTTVWHPGAREHPFMRVSLDMKGADAVAAAQGYISTRAKGRGDSGDDA